MRIISEFYLYLFYMFISMSFVTLVSQVIDREDAGSSAYFLKKYIEEFDVSIFCLTNCESGD